MAITNANVFKSVTRFRVFSGSAGALVFASVLAGEAVASFDFLAIDVVCLVSTVVV